MSASLKITSYCLDWHIKNSDAFRDLLVEPLQPFVDIELTGWDGEHIPKKPSKDLPLVFCMLPPPEALLRDSSQKLIWLPMWDQAQGYSQEWWDKLPKTLRVVAFSDVIYKKAIAAKLPVLRITYFKNPDIFSRVVWDKGLVVFYWNRTGMVGPAFIEKLCAAIQPTKLLFKDQLDPRIEKNKYYDMPARIGNTEIVRVKTTDYATFIKKTESANITIAPRLTEGVGMTFLESMCRGGAVFAHDAPTMSEYIESGKNGFLLDNGHHRFSERSKARIKRVELGDNTPSPYLLSDNQPWGKIAKLNFKALGNRAYLDHVVGYAKWQKDIKDYANFVLNW